MWLTPVKGSDGVQSAQSLILIFSKTGLTLICKILIRISHNSSTKSYSKMDILNDRSLTMILLYGILRNLNELTFVRRKEGFLTKLTLLEANVRDASTKSVWSVDSSTIARRTAKNNWMKRCSSTLAVLRIEVKWQTVLTVALSWKRKKEVAITWSAQSVNTNFAGFVEQSTMSTISIVQMYLDALECRTKNPQTGQLWS